MNTIFISYRRADTPEGTARIHDQLEMYFGRAEIFRDLDRVRGGEAFTTQLERAIASCTVGIVVIGPAWEAAKRDGTLRLFDDDDPVRLEVASLLKRKKPIIPVLLDRKDMPLPSALPPELSELSRIHAVTVTHGVDFHRQVRALADLVQEQTKRAYTEYRDLLEQCRQTGLRAIFDNFLDDSSSRAQITSAEDLIVIQNDGRAWVDSNQELLRRRLARESGRTTIVLCHPKSSFLPILDRKNGKGLEKQIAEIEQSFKLLKSFAIYRDNFRIRGHHGFNPYSLILTEHTAFMDLYLLNRAGALPRLIFGNDSGGGMYETLRNDALKLYEISEDLLDASFA